MTPEQKSWIDTASVEALLYRWRFAKTGDPLTQGSAGEYFSKVMSHKRGTDPDEWVRASKAVGW